MTRGIIPLNRVSVDLWINSVSHIIFCLMGLFAMFASAEPGLKPGGVAPGFELKDQGRKIHRLSDYAGKWVVLYFYPKDDTPGCTIEACHFRDDIHVLRDMGAEVLGVSLDNEASHDKFAKKYGLPFPLLADVKGKVTESYGSLRSMGPLKMAKRHTFIIDPDSKIAQIYRRVNSKIHSEQVIAELKRLQIQ